MRKFAKLLTVIIAVAALLTTFAVVALADEVLPATFTASNGGNLIGDMGSFDDYEGGHVFVEKMNNDGVNLHKINIEETYPGGNKYLLVDGMGSSGGNAGTFYVSHISYSQAYTYNVGDYPYFVLDFDTMTQNGRWGQGPTKDPQNSTKIQIRPYYAKPEGGLTTFGGSAVASPNRISFSELGLDSEAYLWQHVTIIFEYVGNATYNTYVHINGSEEPTYTKLGQDFSADYEAVGSDPDKAAFYSSYISPAYWGQKVQAAIDNYTATYYPAGFNMADIPTYIYNESYEMPEAYKYTVASVTNAEGATAYFDNIDKALAALSDGCTLKIETEAPAAPLIINNAITLNSNGFSVSVKSTEGYGATSVVDGVYTIEKLPSATISWDACQNPDNCTCLSQHKLIADTKVVVGDLPEYVLDIPTLEFNGLVLELIGWSYENDGTVDELVPVTMEDVENGFNLYPVFKQTLYAFSLTVGDTVTYYTAEQYKEVFAAAQAADDTLRTVTLLRDLEVYNVITLDVQWSQSNVRVTFDLRGNTLTKINLIGNKFKYDTASGTYVADGTLAQETNGAYMFYCNKQNNYFTITSSAEERGNLVTYKVDGDIYYDADGKMERYEAKTITGAYVMYWYNCPNRFITLTNLNIYSAGYILNAAGGSNTNCSLTIDNCAYYATLGSDSKMEMAMYFESSGLFTANVTNSLFYYPSGIASGNKFLFRLADNNKKSNYVMNFDNCDVIGGTKIGFLQFYSSSMKVNPDNVVVTVTNSRLYNVSGVTQVTTYIGEGVLAPANYTAPTTLVPGVVVITTPNTATYNLPATSTVTIDSETKLPVLNSATADQTVSFGYETKKASEVAEAFSDVRLSMLYYTDFNLVMYLPVNNGVATDIALSGFTATEGTVKIDGVEYYVYVKASTTTTVSDTVSSTLTYKVDGKDYRQRFEVSALVYADLILKNPENDVEKTAVANMVRYIKEARLASSLTAGAEFDELIALGNLADLGAKETYADETVDYSTLAGYVKSIKFMMNGTNAAYAITLANENVQISVKYVGGEEIALADSATANTKYTTGTKVYDVATNAIEITITVPAADGGEATVVTGTYSAKAYINNTDDTLTKAMYEYGVAAKAYRDYLLENA